MDKTTWERTLVNLTGYAVEIDGALGLLDMDVVTRWTLDAVTVESEVGRVQVHNAASLVDALVAHVGGCRALAQQKKLRHGSTSC